MNSMARTSTTTALPALLYPRGLLARLPGQLFHQRIQRSLTPLRQRAMILETLIVVSKACGLVISLNVPCHTEFDIQPIMFRGNSGVLLQNRKHCLHMALGLSNYAGHPVILEFMSLNASVWVHVVFRDILFAESKSQINSKFNLGKKIP